MKGIWTVWIIFGWEKEQQDLGEIGQGYCYDCRRKTQWVVQNEREWVTFSAIRTFRFANRFDLHCDNCSFCISLNTSEFKAIDDQMQWRDSIDGTALHKRLMHRIELEQLAEKTPQQLKYIRESMAAEEEYRRAIESQQLD